MPVTVVVGAQWGDEGKAKVIDLLSKEHGYVVRYQGGHNAGHTVVVGEERYALQLIPSGILYDHVVPVIANGVVVDMVTLFNEIDTLEVVVIARLPHDIDLTQDAANDEHASPNLSMPIDETSPWWTGDNDLFSNSCTLHDLETARAYMSDEQWNLFNLLDSHLDLPAAAKSSGMSSATFYRRVADLQMHLRMFGIRTPV